MKCIHPRKANHIMRDFINEASTITYGVWHFTSIDSENELTLEEYLNATEQTEEKVRCIIKNSNQFCTYFNEDLLEQGKFVIAVDKAKIKNYFANQSIGGRYVTADFKQRCVIAKGFATITLVLLHELGHQQTREEVEAKYDESEQDLINKKTAIIVKKYKQGKLTYQEASLEVNKIYVTKMEQQLATNWAIEWLQDANHRKMAKAFEKKFFSCYEK